VATNFRDFLENQVTKFQAELPNFMQNFLTDSWGCSPKQRVLRGVKYHWLGLLETCTIIKI